MTVKEHKHKWVQVCPGPFIVIFRCQCGAEIYDEIDRGPGRLEVDPKGVLWEVSPQEQYN